MQILRQFEATVSEVFMASARGRQSAAARGEAMVQASMEFFTPTERRALIAGMTIDHHLESGLDASSLAPDLFERYEVLSSGDRKRISEFEDRPSWER